MIEPIADSGAPGSASSRLKGAFGDRVRVNSALIVLSFVSVLLLDSQSAASLPTYFLSLGMLVTFRHWNDVLHVRMTWAIGGLIGWLVLSGMWSTPFRPGDFVSMLIRGLVVFLFVVALAECQLRGDLPRWLGRTLTLVGLATIVAALWVFFSDPPADGRLNGLGQVHTPVLAALVYGVVLIFMLEVVLTDRSAAWRGVAAAGAVVATCAVYLSGSRNAWVSVVLGIGVFGLAHLVKSPHRFVAAAASLVVVLLALVGAVVANEATRDFVFPRGDSYRPEIWSATLDRILAGNVWIGLGVNTSDDVVIHGIRFLHPHDMYLSVSYQGGLIGLALMAVVLVCVVRSLVLNYRKPDAKLALGVLTVALGAYLLDGHELVDKVGSSWFLFWLPVGVAVGFEWRHSKAL